MSESTKRVNIASKDILARAMAMEDINVIHSADAPSAYFDTKNRTLCLPVWKDMDSAVYDMLVGHEVSHALHTPAEGWETFVGTGKHQAVRHMFLNIVEDARIERLIKDAFPGLRRDFASAYKTFHGQDLFELKNRTIDCNFPLIDRLNLEFKLGMFGLEDIPFTDEERQYVTRMAETTTFEEVVKLANDLFDRHIDDQEEEEEEEETAQSETTEAASSGQGSGDEVGEGESTESSGSGDDSGDDCGDSIEDDTDDGDSAESEQSQDQTDALNYDDYDSDCPMPGATQHSYEKSVENFRDEDAGEYVYHTLPTMNLDECIVDFKTIENEWNTLDIADMYLDERNKQIDQLRTFINQAKPVVNHMVQQFQMKQAADDDKRTDIAKTGILNTTTMINYRWSEDIFLKNEIHSDGKSHGIVIFIDWSGSMHSILKDTVEQLLILTEFCRKVNIPFEVYAFSSNRWTSGVSGMDRWSDEFRKKIEARNEILQFTSDCSTDVQPHTFSLYNFLSSRMKTVEYKTALKNFWILASSEGMDPYHTRIPICLSLGCTPLNEAVVCAMQIVPEFQATNGVQVVNTVFLTDGDGHSIGLRSRYNHSGNASKSIIRDKKTKKTYALEGTGWDAETYALLRMLKDKTGCNTIGIRLHDSKNLRSLQYRFFDNKNKQFEVASKCYATSNYCICPDTSYDLHIVVKGELKVEFDALENLGDDASFTRIKNAFLKGNKNKKVSRVISSQIIDVIVS